jgi:hypothetical protein
MGTNVFDSTAVFTVYFSNGKTGFTTPKWMGYAAVAGEPPMPAITSQPASKKEFSGNLVRFDVTASGTAPLSYKWYFKDKEIAGATGPSYAVTVSETTAGPYKVVVSNALGNAASETATLSIRSAVDWSWSGASANQTVSPGGTFNLGVEVAGGTSITYQWLKDGKAIKGANTNQLSIAQVSAANAGLYALAITTAEGKATTSPIRLAVADPALLIYGLKGTGSTATINGNTQIKFNGLVLMDRAAQRGAIIWLGGTKANKTCSVEARDDLSAHSTGPSKGTSSVFSALAATGTHPDAEQEFIWLSGTDALISLDAKGTKTTVAPATLTGILNSLTLADGVVIQIQNATLALDKAQTIKARTPAIPESLEAAVTRIKGELQAAGYHLVDESVPTP